MNVVHEHPISPEIFQKKKRKAVTISDLLTTPQFHRTAIYNEFYRIYRIDHQLMAPLRIAEDKIVTYTYNRIRRDFSAEERLMIDLFAPHMTNAIRNGLVVERLLSATTHLNAALAERSMGMVAFGLNSELKYMSDCGRVLLDRYYGQSDLGHDGVPTRLRRWVVNCDTLRSTDPMISEFKLTLEKDDSTLGLTIVFSDSNEERIVLLEEHKRPSPIALCSLGLTKRQSEILFWVSQGKTDQDIACLLGISPRTVHKHLENIYVRLGVETRTAAMSTAYDSLSPSSV